MSNHISLGDLRSQELRELVAKYSQSFPVFSAGETARDGVVVLLTGATGAFGSNILAPLLSSREVSRIYVVSRAASNTSVQNRLVAAFKKQGLNEELLQSSKLELFEGDFSRSDLGLPRDTLERLQNSTTHIVHNAWDVDLSLTLSSFQGHIEGVRNLIDFALGGTARPPPRFTFVSSIGVFQNHDPSYPALEELALEPACCFGTGYGESKWVAEQILKAASEQEVEEPLKITIVRVDQMAGGLSGAWNTRDWFPCFVKSSIYLGKIPIIYGSTAWPSYDIAASVFVDMILSADSEQVLHITHSHPVPWPTVIDTIASELGLEIVPYDAWANALGESAKVLESVAHDQDKTEEILQQNPCLRLLLFFKQRQANVESFGSPKLSIEKAQRVSRTLRSARQLDSADVKRWLDYWRSIGFIENKSYLGSKRNS